MKAKKYLPLLILAALVVVLGVALAILSNLDEEEDDSVALFDFDSSSVTALAYQKEETAQTLLQDDSDSWYLEGDPTLPLDQDTASSLVEQYVGLKAARDLGAGTETEDMGLDIPTMVFTLGTDGADISSAETASAETATGETAAGVYTVTIGAENSITEAYYAKVSWNDHIYTISSTDLSDLVKTPQDLYEAQDITTLESDDVTALTLETSTETLSFTKNDSLLTEMRKEESGDIRLITYINSPIDVAKAYKENLAIEGGKKTTIAQVSLQDNDKQRAIDFINYLVVCYNQDILDEKSKVVLQTSDFIRERMEVVNQRFPEKPDTPLPGHSRCAGTCWLRLSCRPGKACPRSVSCP